MKAVGCERAELEVVDLPGPRARRRARSRSRSCAAASAARTSTRAITATSSPICMVEAGYDGFMRSDQQVVFGHEFCGEIADYGPRCRRKLPTGTPVVALPLRRNAGEVHAIGLSAAAPGAYAERTVVEESLMLPVPNGLAPELAALTEPMAVALHAVRRGEVEEARRRDRDRLRADRARGDLHAQGPRRADRSIASDLSPGRRALATACGADVGRRPGGGFAVRGGGRRGPPQVRARGARARGRDDGEADAERRFRGTTSGARPSGWARGRRLRWCSSASACRG